MSALISAHITFEMLDVNDRSDQINERYSRTILLDTGDRFRYSVFGEEEQMTDLTWRDWIIVVAQVAIVWTLLVCHWATVQTRIRRIKRRTK
jgi:hypothetical protein